MYYQDLADWKYLYENKTTEPNDWHNDRFWRIQSPGYYEFEPSPGESNGTSIVIIPGGAYAKLNPYGNGLQYARWFAAHGITAYVLIHRLPNSNGLGYALCDLKEMVNIASKKSNGGAVGVMGCSAGGHLAAYGSNKLTELIDFAVLISPVISMEQNIVTEAHERTIKNIGGDKKEYSCERFVSIKCPRTIIFHSQKDLKVSPEQSTLYFNALNKAGVKTSLHIYSGGQHDFKITGNSEGIEVNGWKNILLDWIYQYS